jgi:hypothetical protein
MTPHQTLKHMILLRACDMQVLYEDIEIEIAAEIKKADVNNIDELYDTLECEDSVSDARAEIRKGDIETGLRPLEYSRYYEVKDVAMKTPLGYVGWSYWYGGGKHSAPAEVDWMNSAYFLDVKEEEKVVIVKTFTRK